MRLSLMILTGVAALTASSAAVAAPVMSGTVSSAVLFNPTVSVASSPATYGANFGSTFQISGTGGFSNLANTKGTLNGTLSFGQVVGTVIAQSLNNFFVFDDMMGGTYNFAVASVQTNSFVDTAASTSGSLYVVGGLTDSNSTLAATPSSLTIQFNRTGSSAYSSALSLSVPPTGAVPEPAAWAMMILGMGAIGYSMRRRRATVQVRQAA